MENATEVFGGLAPYDDELIEHVAWKLAEAAGFRYGRCARINKYVETVRDIVVSLEVASEERARGEWT